MARTTRAPSSRRTQRFVVAAGLFVIAAAALTVMFGVLFESYALGVAPALIMAGAIVAVFLVATRRTST